MTFSDAVEYLYSLGNEVSAMKQGLENMGSLLAELGDPHEKYLKVQVAGTNGKGSVCAFLHSICNAAGIKSGLYTSPHLVSVTERIRIGGVDIAEDDFARLSDVVRKTSESLLAEKQLEYLPTFFEQMTTIALLAFADANVELAILETGLGGRLDATTAANAEVAAITQIALDHQEYLGNTIEEIAAEKAAIIRPDSHAVIGDQEPRAMKVLLDHCERAGVVPMTIRNSPVSAVNPVKESAVGLAGRHQIENASIAIRLAEVLSQDFEFPISTENIWTGLEEARHPGRLEYVDDRYLLDGAHNTAGAKALRAFLDEFETRPITLIFGAMAEKDVSQMASILFPRAKNVLLTRADNTRALPAAELRKFVANASTGSILETGSLAEALDSAEKIAGPDGLILITGSLYLVGEAKKLLNNR